MTEHRALIKIISYMLNGYQYTFERDTIVFYGQDTVELEEGKEREIVDTYTIPKLRGKLAELKKRIKV